MNKPRVFLAGLLTGTAITALLTVDSVDNSKSHVRPYSSVDSNDTDDGIEYDGSSDTPIEMAPYAGLEWP